MASRNDSRANGYLAAVKGYAQLTREEELVLMRRWHDGGDLPARDALVRSQLRTVVSIADKYRRYCATLDELIAEGNFGLVHALSKFDPERGTRFVTYAAYWIRAYILAHLARSRTLVTTGVHSKLLSKLKRERSKIVGILGDGAETDAFVAKRLNISAERMSSLQERLELRDLPLYEDNGDSAVFRVDALTAKSPTGEETLIFGEARRHALKAVSRALQTLDARERYIVEARLMAHAEDELSLADIGRHLGVSRERARQLEARAKRKIKSGLSKDSVVQDFSDAFAAA